MNQDMPDELLELIAAKFQMLADPTRLAILRTLMKGEKSVGQVVTETGGGQANVSKHLKLLADSSLVRRRKEGLQVYYRLDDPLVERLCTLVCSAIQSDLERSITKQRQFLRDGGNLPVIRDGSAASRPMPSLWCHAWFCEQLAMSAFLPYRDRAGNEAAPLGVSHGACPR